MADLRKSVLWVCGDGPHVAFKLEDIKSIIEDFKTGDCWCPMGIGHPAMKSHTKKCIQAAEFVQMANEVLKWRK